jgi:hypothetical protein
VLRRLIGLYGETLSRPSAICLRLCDFDEKGFEEWTDVLTFNKRAIRVQLCFSRSWVRGSSMCPGATASFQTAAQAQRASVYLT